jgi:hypothetical protein
MKWGVFLSVAGLAASVVSAAPAQIRPFNYTFKNKYAEVDFSWSKEASAVPELVKRFRYDMAKARVDSIKCGKLETEIRRKTGSPVPTVICSSSTKVTTSGQSPRLLSLSRKDWAFTGGAHGNGATSGLLWDRNLRKEISFGSLFLQTNGYSPGLRAPYCRALDKERNKRRWSGYQPGAVPEFDACPKFSDLALIPADSNRNDRFDRIHVIAPPYIAGSFAEGEYDITLPVTAALVAAMKPEYRSSFEAQRQ